MCLIIDKKQTRIMREHLKAHGKITVYKMVWFESERLRSYFYQWVWHPEWNVSNRGSAKMDSSETGSQAIFCGFHVYFKREDAEIVANKSPQRRIIELTGNADDFVACSAKEAVFSKLYLAKEEYDRNARADVSSSA